MQLQEEMCICKDGSNMGSKDLEELDYLNSAILDFDTFPKAHQKVSNIYLKY
jgi:hypothetical protein